MVTIDSKTAQYARLAFCHMRQRSAKLAREARSIGLNNHEYWVEQNRKYRKAYEEMLDASWK